MLYIFICKSWMLFFRDSCISSLDPSATVYSTIHIVEYERLAYCKFLHLTLNHLTLAAKYIQTLLSTVNGVAY